MRRLFQRFLKSSLFLFRGFFYLIIELPQLYFRAASPRLVFLGLLLISIVGLKLTAYPR